MMLFALEQSVFLNSRKILYGPLVVNEMVHWFKQMKKKLMIFKLDFEKAYDSGS